MKQGLSILALLFFLICSAQAPTNGLVAYWPMNGNYNDASGSGLNATNTNCTATSDVFGNSDSAMNLTNTTLNALVVNQYGFVPVNPILNFGLTDDFTVDFNVYFTPFSFRNGGGIFDYGLNDHWSWGIAAFDNHAAGDNLQLHFYYASKLVSSTPLTLSYNRWYHLTFMKSGTQGRIYINGVLNASGDFNSTPNYSPVTGGYFGAIHYANYNPPYYAGLNGKIDEFRIYNRALTDVEIQDILSVSLGVSEHSVSDRNILFYPNPAENSITFTADIQSLEIFDAFGKKIDVNIKDNQADISQLSKGLYFVKYLSKDVVSVEKLLKK